MKINYVTQIQNQKQGTFNSFSRQYPTPVQQQAIQNFTKFYLGPAQKIIRQINDPRMNHHKPVINPQLDQMVKQQKNFLYDSTQFDQSPIVKPIINDSIKIKTTQLQRESPVNLKLQRLYQSLGYQTRGAQLSKSVNKNVVLTDTLRRTFTLNTSVYHQSKKNKDRSTIASRLRAQSPPPFMEEMNESSNAHTHTQKSGSRKEIMIQPLYNDLIEGKFMLPAKSQKVMKIIDYTQLDTGNNLSQDNLFDGDIYQEYKRLNDIITQALLKKANKAKPINASLSRKFKKAQMNNYLSREFKKSQIRVKLGEYSFDDEQTQIAKNDSGESKLLYKRLSRSTHDQMLNSFQQSNKRLLNSHSVQAEQHKQLYLKCYDYFANE